MHIPHDLEIPFLSAHTTEQCNYVHHDTNERIFIIVLIVRTSIEDKTNVHQW